MTGILDPHSQTLTNEWEKFKRTPDNAETRIRLDAAARAKEIERLNREFADVKLLPAGKKNLVRQMLETYVRFEAPRLETAGTRGATLLNTMQFFTETEQTATLLLTMPSHDKDNPPAFLPMADMRDKTVARFLQGRDQFHTQLGELGDIVNSYGFSQTVRQLDSVLDQMRREAKVMGMLEAIDEMNRALAPKNLAIDLAKVAGDVGSVYNDRIVGMKLRRASEAPLGQIARVDEREAAAFKNATAGYALAGYIVDAEGGVEDIAKPTAPAPEPKKKSLAALRKLLGGNSNKGGV